MWLDITIGNTWNTAKYRVAHDCVIKAIKDMTHSAEI